MKEKYLVVTIKEDNFDEAWNNIKHVAGVKDSFRFSLFRGIDGSLHGYVQPCSSHFNQPLL